MAAIAAPTGFISDWGAALQNETFSTQPGAIILDFLLQWSLDRATPRRCYRHLGRSGNTIQTCAGSSSNQKASATKVIFLKWKSLKKLLWIVFVQLSWSFLFIFFFFLFLFFSFFVFVFANHCQCQSITVLASVNLLLLLPYTLFSASVARSWQVVLGSVSPEMDWTLAAGARSRSWDTGSCPTLYCTPVAKLIYAAKGKKEKANYFFLFFFCCDVLVPDWIPNLL